jgi:phage shock PspC-like protein
VINLSPYIFLGKEAKWRGQNMKIRLAIPEGKKVRFADNIDLWTAVVKGDANYDDTEFANTLWTVENGKVKCLEGENHRNAKASSDDEKEEKKVSKHSEKVKHNNKKSDDKENGDKEEKDEDDKDF